MTYSYLSLQYYRSRIANYCSRMVNYCSRIVNYCTVSLIANAHIQSRLPAHSIVSINNETREKYQNRNSAPVSVPRSHFNLRNSATGALAPHFHTLDRQTTLSPIAPRGIPNPRSVPKFPWSGKRLVSPGFVPYLVPAYFQISSDSDRQMLVLTYGKKPLVPPTATFRIR
jgi:hypothetical protein